jgi:hypothetical protein
VTCNIYYPIYCRGTKLASTRFRPQTARWSPQEGERDGEWEVSVSGAVRRTTGMFSVGATASSILHTDWRQQVLPRKPQWTSELYECFPGWENGNSSFTKKSCTCAWTASPAGFRCWPVNSSNCGRVRVVSSACICPLVQCHVAVSNAQYAASNGELERTWKKMVVAWFKVLFQLIPTGTQENHRLSVTLVGIASQIRTRHVTNYHIRRLASK